MGVWGAVAGLLFFAVICYGSLEGAGHAWSSNEFEGEGALRVPVWPARFMIILGTGLASLSYLLTMLENLRRALGDEPPVQSSAVH